MYTTNYQSKSVNVTKVKGGFEYVATGTVQSNAANGNIYAMTDFRVEMFKVDNAGVKTQAGYYNNSINQSSVIQFSRPFTNAEKLELSAACYQIEGDVTAYLIDNTAFPVETV